MDDDIHTLPDFRGLEAANLIQLPVDVTMSEQRQITVRLLFLLCRRRIYELTITAKFG
jgi:hypothetical protein